MQLEENFQNVHTEAHTRRDFYYSISVHIFVGLTTLSFSTRERLNIEVNPEFIMSWLNKFSLLLTL